MVIWLLFADLYEPLCFGFDADLLDDFGQMVANRQEA